MKKYLDINKKAYNQLSEEYEKRIEEYIVLDKKISAPFIKHLKKTFKKIRVLDLGPGTGIDLSIFEKQDFETTAIDISEKMIKISKKMAPNTKYIYDDFLSHNFGRKKFEGIFAKAFIHLFPTKDAILVLKKIRNLLAPKGFVFISTTFHPKAEEGYFEKKDYSKKIKRFRKKWEEQELIETLEDLGFGIILKKYNYEKDKDKKWISLYLKLK